MQCISGFAVFNLYHEYAKKALWVGWVTLFYGGPVSRNGQGLDWFWLCTKTQRNHIFILTLKRLKYPNNRNIYLLWSIHCKKGAGIGRECSRINGILLKTLFIYFIFPSIIRWLQQYTNQNEILHSGTAACPPCFLLVCEGYSQQICCFLSFAWRILVARSIPNRVCLLCIHLCPSWPIGT